MSSMVGAVCSEASVAEIIWDKALAAWCLPSKL